MKLIQKLLLILLACSTVAGAYEIPIETQVQMIEDYLLVSGRLDQARRNVLAQYDVPEHEYPVKCGMSAAADFALNRGKFDLSLLKALGSDIFDRDTLTDTTDSPAGLFRIHYTRTGTDAVWEANIDINSNGIPDYVESVATIFDSVYNSIINDLGYPVPPNDGFYPSGGDEKFDVYIKNLGSGYFGLTYPDSVLGSTSTAFMVIDHDFQSIPSYVGRPLDAVRVTAAHEFYHAVQFGMDVFEFENPSGGIQRRYWMEASSTWMEEQLYDDINDYYNYIGYFFNDPSSSLQQFNSGADVHPYASVVYPIYLTERFGGPDIIREIWERCGSIVGPNFLLAANSVIDSVSSGNYDWGSAFSEFALWNYFTGSRAALAPIGIGYSERSDYLYQFPDDKLAIIDSFPKFYGNNQNPWNPHHNAAIYVKLDNLYAYETEYDTTWWVCESGSYPDGTNCTLVDDTTTAAEMYIDSLMSIYFTLDTEFPQPWGMKVLFELVSAPDSFIVASFTLAGAEPRPSPIQLPYPQQYQSVTFILTPASPFMDYYDPWAKLGVGILVEGSGYVPPPPPLEAFDVDVIGFPNPAVVSQMSSQGITIRATLTSDTLGVLDFEPYMSVEIFNVAGEHIASLESLFGFPTSDGYDRFDCSIEWDMRNSSGKEVASGVYIGVVQLWTAQFKGALLAEDKVKLMLVK